MQSARQILDDAAFEGLRQKSAHDVGMGCIPEDRTRMDAQEVVRAARQQIERQEWEKIHAEIGELQRSLRAFDERLCPFAPSTIVPATTRIT